TVCIEVDDVEAALNNLAPYSDWQITTWNHVAVIFTDDVTACALGMSDFQRNEISVYPNPTSDSVILENLEGNTTINVLDFTGKLVCTTQTVHESLQLDLTGFTKGIYLVQIISRDKTMVKKLVVN